MQVPPGPSQPAPTLALTPAPPPHSHRQGNATAPRSVSNSLSTGPLVHQGIGSVTFAAPGQVQSLPGSVHFQAASKGAAAVPKQVGGPAAASPPARALHHEPSDSRYAYPCLSSREGRPMFRIDLQQQKIDDLRAADLKPATCHTETSSAWRSGMRREAARLHAIWPVRSHEFAPPPRVPKRLDAIAQSGFATPEAGSAKDPMRRENANHMTAERHEVMDEVEL